MTLVVTVVIIFALWIERGWIGCSFGVGDGPSIDGGPSPSDDDGGDDDDVENLQA